MHALRSINKKHASMRLVERCCQQGKGCAVSASYSRLRSSCFKPEYCCQAAESGSAIDGVAIDANGDVEKDNKILLRYHKALYIGSCLV